MEVQPQRLPKRKEPAMEENLLPLDDLRDHLEGAATIVEGRAQE